MERFICGVFIPSIGSGLGKEESGIKEAIKVKYKFDSKGVGHEPGKEYSFHWWDHVFNKAANSIQVETSENGVQVKKAKNTDPLSNKKSQVTASKTLLYGNFTKGATLQRNKEGLQCEVSDGDDSSSHSESDDEKYMTLSKISEEEIFKKCGGRTAHKGARHGLKLNGKLLRIQEQEKRLVEKLMNRQISEQPDDHDNGIDEKYQSKKKKKRKKDKNNAEPSDNESDIDNIGHECVNVNADDVIQVSKKPKKKRKRDKDSSTCVAICELIEDNDVTEGSLAEQEENIIHKSKKKKKKERDIDNNIQSCDIKDEPSNIDVCSDDYYRKTKKKKKKKRKETV